MIRVNGEFLALDKAVGFAEWLDERGLDAARVAVEHNGVILPRGNFSSTILQDGDILEIITFVGGG